MTRVAIACGRANPALGASNAAYAEALAALGAEVSTPRWNVEPAEAFLDADIVTLRQTWDYQDDAAGFAAWLSRLAMRGASIANPAPVAIWNNDKRCLIELGRAGVAIPPTIDLAADGIEAAEALAREAGAVVLKPAHGGGGVGVRRAAPGGAAAALAEAQAEAPGRPFMAQAFLPEIAAGEWSLVFVDGAYSHAVLKLPAQGEFRVNSRFRPQVRRAEPPAAAVEAAAAALGPCESADAAPTLYARVDGVLREDRLIVTEVELTDPDLHLHLAPEAARALAAATLARAGGLHAAA